MSGLLIGLGLVGLVVWLASTGYIEAVLDAWHQRGRAMRLQTELHLRNADVADEHRRARQAMNDAARQSWRNPFE